MAAPPPNSFLCPITVGREVERERLRAFLARESGVLLVSGEPGVGKSRLVREAQLLAAEHGALALEAHCFEADRALPLSPALDLLATMTERRGVTEVARLAAAAPDLARLLPELAPEIEATARAGSDEERAKRRLFDGFAQLLDAIASGLRAPAGDRGYPLGGR